MGQIHDGCRHYDTGSPIAIVPTGKFCGHRYVREGDLYADGAIISVDDVEIRNAKFNGTLQITGSNVRIVSSSFSNITGNAIEITGTSDVILEDLKLNEITENGVLVTGSNDFAIKQVRGDNIGTAHAADSNPSAAGEVASLRIEESTEFLVDDWRTTNNICDGFAFIECADGKVVNSRLRLNNIESHQIVNLETSLRSAFRIHKCVRIHTFASDFVESWNAGILVTDIGDGEGSVTGTSQDIMFMGCVADGAYGRTAAELPAYSALGDSLNFEECIMARVIGCTIAHGIYDGLKHGNAVEGSVTLGNYCYLNGAEESSHGDGFNVAGSSYGMVGFNWFDQNARDGLTLKTVSSPDYDTHDWAAIGNVCTRNGTINVNGSGLHLESSEGSGIAYHRTTLACNISNDNAAYGMANTTHDTTSFGLIAANNKSGAIGISGNGQRIQHIGDVWHGGPALTSNYMVTVADGIGANDVQFGYILALGVDPIADALTQGDVSVGGTEPEWVFALDGRTVSVGCMLSNRLSEADMAIVGFPDIELRADGLHPVPQLLVKHGSSNADYRYREQGQNQAAEEIREDLDGSRTLTRDDTGFIWTNTSMAVEHTHYLLAPEEDDTFEFLVQDLNGIRAIAESGDKIIVEGVTSSSGGQVSSTDPGAYIKLVAVDNTFWVAVEVSGSWTVT